MVFFISIAAQREEGICMNKTFLKAIVWVCYGLILTAVSGSGLVGGGAVLIIAIAGGFAVWYICKMIGPSNPKTFNAFNYCVGDNFYYPTIKYGGRRLDKNLYIKKRAYFYTTFGLKYIENELVKFEGYKKSMDSSNPDYDIMCADYEALKVALMYLKEEIKSIEDYVNKNVVPLKTVYDFSWYITRKNYKGNVFSYKGNSIMEYPFLFSRASYYVHLGSEAAEKQKLLCAKSLENASVNDDNIELLIAEEAAINAALSIINCESYRADEYFKVSLDDINTLNIPSYVSTKKKELFGEYADVIKETSDEEDTKQESSDILAESDLKEETILADNANGDEPQQDDEDFREIPQEPTPQQEPVAMEETSQQEETDPTRQPLPDYDYESIYTYNEPLKEKIKKGISAITKYPAQCEKCGALLTAKTQYCPECGTKIIPKNRCEKCGKKIPEDSKFCPRCGYKRS